MPPTFHLRNALPHSTDKTLETLLFRTLQR
jgi:hypothetical protein